MPALRYYLRDPESGEVREAAVEELQALVAQTQKPLVFSCLGRDGFSGKTDPYKQVRCVEGFFSAHKPEDGHVIAVISGEKMTDNKLTNYMHRFNMPRGRKPEYGEEHENPQSFGMQFLKDVIEPAIPYAGWTTDGEHARLLEQTKIKLSQCNFFCHSFGTVVMSEAFDCLREMLVEKGYTRQEAEDCAKCMGKLNVGNPYHITEEHSRVPGIDFNSALDQVVERHNNIPAHSDSHVLALARIGDSLQLCPLIGSESVPTADIQPTAAATPQERKHFCTGITPGAGRPARPDPWELVVGDISDPNRNHALQLYMYTDRLRIDPRHSRARATGQAYPGAEMANRFMAELFETSIAATRDARPRDTRELVGRLEAELAPAAARDALGENLRRSQEAFERHFLR